MLLPFATLAKNRNEPFLQETENAAIFCLAELERRKGSGIVIKQPAEELAFIAKFSYPFWLVPFYETSLVFDGLGMASHTLSFVRIQDVEAFFNGVESSSSSRQIFMTFLSDNINYFQVAGEDEKKVLNSLVANPSLIQDFASYLLEAKPFESRSFELVPLSPTVEEAYMLSIKQELDELRKRFERDVEALNKTMMLLDTKNKNLVKSINREIKEVKDAFNTELEKHKGPVEEKVKEIRNQHDTQVTAASKKFEKEHLRLQKEKVKQEKMEERLSSKIARCEIEIKTHGAKKDAVSEKKWKEERSKLKKERSHVESDIKKLEQEIAGVEDDKSSEIFRIRSEQDAKIQEATKELLEIESARDAKVQILQQEKEKIEELTSSIIQQIDKAAKNRETSLHELGTLGVPQRQKKHVLIYVPFYLICFQDESKRRFMYIPPSMVNSVRLMVKIKGALGKAKIKQLLTPRSEAIASTLNNVIRLTEENAVFEREIVENGVKANILQRERAKESVISGIDKLKMEEWLSEKERASFVQSLA
jgi:hypothetical protein